MQLQSPDTLDTVVYNRLKTMISTNELKAGELLVQNRLTKMLGVSRTPLRKALAQLEKEGLLAGSPKGWYVKEFTVDDMVSVFEIRAVLEGLACRLAAERMTAADISYCRTLFDEAYEAYRDGKTEAYYHADVEFHALLIAKAKDAILEQTIRQTQVLVKSQLQGLYRNPHETIHEHRRILDALADRNGNLAESLMREHIQRAIPLLRSGTYELYR